ncbi:MAG: hypothetical protein WD826_04485 [Actinomycetota bacterium]
MSRTQLEFFDALKPYVGEEGARLIAEAFPPGDLVTKDYLDAKLDAKFGEFKAEIRGWMLAFFVPLWIGVYGTLAAIVVSILVAS